MFTKIVDQDQTSRISCLGWGKICKVFCITPGTVEDCVANLKEGNLLCIYPGGVREALFSPPESYQIMWGKRLGFAKVVLGANVVSGVSSHLNFLCYSGKGWVFLV